MIANEEEYRIAKSEAEKFERAVATARAQQPSHGVHPRAHEAMIESLESELAVLHAQLDRYEMRKGA